VVDERERLRLAAADAAEALGRALHASGDVAAAVEALRRAIELDRFRDGAWRLIVDLRERQGDRAAAHAAPLQHRRVLVDLGVPPDDRP
jgi:DNA-binding SARP family transcriptional activator